MDTRDTERKKVMANPKYKQSKSTGRFEPSGQPVMAEKPICVRLPLEVDAAVRDMPDRAEFLREVITTAVLERQQRAS